MTPDEVSKWLDDVRTSRPGILDKEIAFEIGRSDQWLADAKKTGVKMKTPVLAMRWYLHSLQKPKCAR